MLGSNVQRHSERRSLSGNTGDMNDTLGIIDAGLAGLGRGRRIQPSTYGQLSRADRMSEIDIKTGVVANSIVTLGIIF